jgi:Domain of unknown function (DUF1876)
MFDKKQFYQEVVDLPQLDSRVVHAIFTDDVAAVEVEVWINGKEYYSAKGSARRDPADHHNPEIAIKLALGRAYRKVGREILHEAQGLVRDADHVAKMQKMATLAAIEKKEAHKAKVAAAADELIPVTDLNHTTPRQRDTLIVNNKSRNFFDKLFGE